MSEHKDLALGLGGGRTVEDGFAFVEVVGAHGVADERGAVRSLRAAGE